MAKSVIVHRSDTHYDDEPGIQYHFPKSYLKRLERSISDWVVYFSPVKDKGVSPDARGCYCACVKIKSIVPDQSSEGHFYAHMEPSSFLSFATPVPRKLDGDYVEPKMRTGTSKPNSGVVQNAVRNIDDATFARILQEAWADEQNALPRASQNNPADSRGFAEKASEFVFEDTLEIVAQLSNRPRRNARFRLAILNAYDNRCAITGWHFINGGGRAEVEAAHIKPVQHQGPDHIRNGIALSGTLHWMFDRGLIGVADNHEILVSRKVNDVDGVRRIINPTGKLIAPPRPEHTPHHAFLMWHRDHHKLYNIWE